MEILGIVVLTFVLIVLVLALIGFICIVVWLMKPADKIRPKNDQFVSQTTNGDNSGSAEIFGRSSLKNDILAARRVVEYLYQQEKIDSQRYCEYHKFLQENFPNEMLFNRYPISLKAKTETNDIVDFSNREGDLGVVLENDQIEKIDIEMITAEAVSNDSEADPIDFSSHLLPKPIEDPVRERVATTDSVPMASRTMAKDSARPAPWDLPDPPTPSRVSRRELLAQFMREKNMRWGELTSGVLIVMSAIGLVVSLRNDFLGRIPYFSSLMFMLITAALIGGGIYTLKKWKLRKTSRGVLVIGLLLIPLNFLAACILSGGDRQRSLDDPILWLATVIGLVVFSLLAWVSSTGLFRRPSLGLIVTVVGSGGFAMWFHRWPQISDHAASSLLTTLLLVPLGCLLLWVAGGLSHRFWFKEYWSQRRLVRSYLQIGIGIFSILAAISMLLVSTDSIARAIVSVTPMLIFCSMMVAWLGGLILNRRHSNRGSNPVVGKSLEIMGWVLAVSWLAVSILIPTLFVVNCFLMAAGLTLYLLVITNQLAFSTAKILVLSSIWGLLSAAFLMSLNLYWGHLEFDSWSSWQELGSALLSGRSGLILLGCGVLVTIGQAGLANTLSNVGSISAFDNASNSDLDSQSQSYSQSSADSVHRIRRTGLVSGGIIFLVGCLLAVVASLVNRQNQMDAHIASSLLMFGGILANLFVVWQDRRLRPSLTSDPVPDTRQAFFAHSIEDYSPFGVEQHQGQQSHIENSRQVESRNQQRSRWLSIAAAVCAVTLMFSAWLHLLVWNLSGSTWLSEQTGSFIANPCWGIAMASLFLSGVVYFVRSREIEPIVLGSTVIGLVVVSVAAAYLMWDQTGNGTALLAVTTLGLVMCGFATRSGPDIKAFCAPSLVGTLAVLASGLGVVALTMEWGFSLAWREEPLPRHLMMQAIGGGAWSIFWTLLVMIFPVKSSLAWLGSGRLRVEQIVLLLWVVVVTLFVSMGLADLAGLELFAESVKSYDWFYQIQWMVIAVAVLALAAGLIYLHRPNLAFAGVIVILWMIGWGMGANYFESTRAAVSGLRWLWGAAGLILAILFSLRGLITPGWIKLRRKARLPGRSRFASSDLSRLMDTSLMIFAGLVIGLGFVKLCQTLLVGPMSLGGPTVESWFHSRPIVSYAIPLVMLVSSFLWLAISERRVFLAFAGSVVLQVLAVIAIFFAVYSPFVEITTTLLVHSFHAISIGMTVFGMVWYMFRNRIDATLVERSMMPNFSAKNRSFLLRPLESHLWINAALLTSLSLLVMWRFYWQADQPGGWVSMIGNVGGQLAVILFVGFALFLLRREIGNWSMSKAAWGICWLGLIVIGFAAAAGDWYPQPHRPLLAYRILCWGTVGLAALILAWLRTNHWRMRTVRSLATLKVLIAGGESSSSRDNIIVESPLGSLAAILTVLILCFLFSLQDVLMGNFLFEGLSLQVLIICALIVLAIFTWYSTFYFLAAGTMLVSTGLFVFYQNLPGDQPWLLNLSGVGIVLVALSNLLVYFYFRNQKRILPPRRFVSFANIGIFFCSLWIGLAALLEWPLAGWFGSSSVILNRSGGGLLAGTLSILILSLWNDRRYLWIFNCGLMSLALAVLVHAAIGINFWEQSFDQNSAMAALAVITSVTLLWGLVWIKREVWVRIFRRCHVPRLATLVKKIGKQSIVYTVAIGALAILAACLALIFVAEDRSYRYLMALIPLILAGTFACFSNSSDRRWLQVGCLGLVTLGALYTAWAGLLLEQMQWPETLSMIVSSVMVLAGATFIYGFLIPRWVRAEDSWLSSFRQMTGITGGSAVGALMLLLLNEAARFNSETGCGLAMAQSIAVMGSVIAMIVGLISVAVRPIFDPYSLSLEGRKGYVYLAQIVTAGLALHLYLTMPWLFRLGIIHEYWPYLAMMISFSGVGLGTLLQRRQLSVLGEPLFVTATILPIAISMGIFVVDSQADTSLIFLIVGVVYLLANQARPSLITGLAVVLFCNLSVWFFYGKYDGFSLISHPQWWLIPPAISTLIAGQIYRSQISNQQLTALRYVCVSIIYISSTSEIFINKLGEKLVPPMILAGLSVAGILLGMLVQVRAFLFFGLAFLLMAMISMVAHAHQRFDHVWPWWAFGIILGIIILVMFGIFEKRKKEFKKSGISMDDY